jgi:hypothetical protein
MTLSRHSIRKNQTMLIAQTPADAFGGRDTFANSPSFSRPVAWV